MYQWTLNQLAIANIGYFRQNNQLKIYCVNTWISLVNEGSTINNSTTRDKLNTNTEIMISDYRYKPTSNYCRITEFLSYIRQTTNRYEARIYIHTKLSYTSIKKNTTNEH